MINDAYLAGFIDGEGTIGIRYHKEKRHRSETFTIDLNFSITNSNKPILELIQKEIGGKIELKTKMTKNSKAVYGLRLYNTKDTLNILNRVIPYLILKKEQAELIIAFCNLRAKHTKRDGYTKEEKEIANKVINLNKRGLGLYRKGYYELLNKTETEIRNQKSLVPNATP
ncbi:MAG: LAGLIDADG family homing endonuclease [Candidatus Marsarchaeota archaeon]|nr:LAGLIDADG family homing endonuclease [Candidatus Marsarchaeota archaeon]